MRRLAFLFRFPVNDCNPFGPGDNRKEGLSVFTDLSGSSGEGCFTEKEGVKEQKGRFSPGFNHFSRLFDHLLSPPVFGNVLKSLYQTHSPQKPDMYYQANNDLVHLFRFRETNAFPH
jgi:hypothetical protein